MGKVYKNGIVSPKGFDMAAGEPVDQREIVESLNDLTSLPHTYPGIEVKVVGEQYKEYKLIRTPSGDIANWIEVVPEYNQPAQQTTDTVLNNSNLPGTTTTEALNSLAFGATGTYDEIRAIRDGNRLTPGSRYTITDYQTKYFIEGSNSSGKKIYMTVASVFGPGAQGYLVFTDFQPLLQAGQLVVMEELPPGYITGVTGPYAVGDTSTCRLNFSDFYFKMENPNWAADETLVGAKMSYSLPRYENIPDDTLTVDGSGRPIMQPQGIVNTDVHDGAAYMDHSAADNYPVPSETIILIAASPNSFQVQGFSGTYLGDTIYYDMDLDEVINDNLEVIASRNGSIFRRRSKDFKFDIECDWRVQRYRRYLLSDADKLKFINDDTPLNAGQNGTFIVGEDYRITQKGNASTVAEWQAIGAATGDLGERFTCIFEGVRNDGPSVNLSTAYLVTDAVDLVVGEWYDIQTVGTTDFTLIGSNEVIAATSITIGDVCKIVTVGDTDYTLIGSNNVIAATAITIGDICKIETVGDTDYTLIGSTDNVVGTIFTATGVGVGTGTVDIGNNVDSIFTATDVGVGTGTVDIGNNVGFRFQATGTDLGTGEVSYANLVRHPQSGESLFTSIYRDPLQDDGYYVALTPEEEISTMDRWANRTVFKAEIADSNTRAKDFRTIPMKSDYYPDPQYVSEMSFIGQWSNVIIDTIPGGVFSILSSVTTSGKLNNIYIASGLLAQTGDGLFMTNIRAVDFVQFLNGVQACALTKVNMLSPVYFSGGMAGMLVTDSIVAGTRELMRSSNDSFSWAAFYDASALRLSNSAISCRVGALFLNGVYIADSAMFMGGDEDNTGKEPESRKIYVDNSSFNNTVLRFLGSTYHNTIASTSTAESNTSNPRGQYEWTIPGDIYRKEITINAANNSLIINGYDVDNNPTVTVLAEVNNK